ncbi:hypothetical protein HUG15_19875 [Salicibibacter cibarius]|uniref:Uncharacterized protein n=1 Tax=Salicibibacter cibarius TaxID=2743000 RepID=A0A7T6Z664_9BACI|nr:hypothetical protein [Salicibibacter cibarius]QQK77619.1 hypothetical protein HUG15_19875 [Salicibibacter cibarius]
MDHLACVMDVQRRADKMLKKSGVTEHEAYVQAMTDVMHEQRKKIPTDQADHLHAFLLRNFGIE